MTYIVIISKATFLIEECFRPSSAADESYHFHVMHAVMIVAINSNQITAEFSNN